MRRLTFRATTALGLLGLLVVVMFRGALLQEGNPFPILWGILKLETGQADLVPVSADPPKFVQRSSRGTEPLSTHLAPSGWTYQDQMGAGIFYERQGRRLGVISRMFTTRYVIYQLDRQP